MSDGGATIARRIRGAVYSFREDLMRVVFIVGVAVLVFGLSMNAEIKVPVILFGASLIITGFVGVYMMYTTKKIAQNLYDGMDEISGKIDTMSEQLSGKIDTMSEQLSGKMDTQTDILKEIRDTLKSQKAA